MTASRSLLGVFLVLAMVAAACSGGDAEPTPEPTETKSDVPTPTPTPTPTATPTPTPTPEPVLFPLTGDEAEDEDRLGFAALGVKIDNSPAARPQLGLDQADIVFEELVEGGITRFLGIFQSVDPDEVGPVRSGRDVDADIFPPFQGILAISGAAGPTYSVLFGAGLEVFEEGQAGGAIYRVSDRPAPHNLNAIADQLWEAGSSAGPAIEPWPFDEAIPDDGEPIEAVEARFSQEYGHSWAWREDDGVFERGQNGTRHLAASGEQVSAANVIYASVAVGAGGGVDINNAGTVSVALIGEGSATFLRDGQLFTGSWRKTSRESQFEWLDESGAPFPLAPGQTWIELQPNGFGVDSDPQGQVDADAPTPEPTAGQ